MAWRIPPSQTTTVTLANGDDVFIGGNVAITVEGDFGIRGAFSGHQALIYGLVASTNVTISLGNSDTHSSHVLEVKAGGHVQHMGGASIGVALHGFNSSVINAGLISAPHGSGVLMSGINADTTSTVSNSGTIEALIYALLHHDTEKLVVTNSGTISGGDRSLSSTGSAIESVTNSGRMIGAIDFGGGNDVYSGASAG